MMSATPLTDHAVFGEQEVNLGFQVVVDGGVSGSDGAINLNAEASADGIQSGGAVSLGFRASVDGDVTSNSAITVQTQAGVSGDIDALGNVSLGFQSEVAGDVVSAGSIFSNQSVVLGEPIELGDPEVYEEVSLPGVSNFTTDSANDIFVPFQGSTDLAADEYGDLIVGSQGTVTLTAGTYTFDRVSIGFRGNLNLDVSAGDIEIFVAQDTSIQGEVDVQVLGGDAGDIYLETGGNFFLGFGAEFEGTVFAPTADITIGGATEVIGALYSGGRLSIGSGGRVVFEASDRLTGSGTGPVVDVEPPTLDVRLVNDTGSDSLDGVTADPSLAGTVSDASGVASLVANITFDGVSVGTADLTGVVNGADAFDVGRAGLEGLLGANLADGQYAITLTATDTVGNTASSVVNFVLDTTAPQSVVLASPDENALVNTNVAVAGVAAEAGLVEVQIDGGPFVPVALDGANSFSVDTTFATDGTGDGPHTVGIRLTDAAGNVSSVVERSFVLDTQIAVPTLLVTDAESGAPVSSGVVVAASVLSFSGVADPGDTVTLSDASQGVLGVAVADETGAWVLFTDGLDLVEGDYLFTATAQDVAGNTSEVSEAVAVTLDATPPTLAVDVPGTGNLTNTNFAVNGVVTDANITAVSATVDGGAAQEIILDAAGNFSFETDFALTGSDDGTHALTFSAVDQAGNLSDPVVVELVLDTVALAPVITAITQDTGSSQSDFLTSDRTLVVSGTAEVGAIVTLEDAALGILGTATVAADGTWVIDATSIELPEGQIQLTARQTDAAGNTSADSAPLDVILDATAPALQLGIVGASTVVNTNPVFNGTATDLNGVEFLEAQIDDGAFFAVPLNGDGSLELSTDFLLDGTADGEHSVAVRASDAAGNLSALVSVSFTLDTQVATPVITGFSPDTGVSDTDGLTNANRLLFTGTADPDSVVSLTEATLGFIAEAAVDSNGAFTLDATGIELADGNHSFTATATDAAGNVSGSSDSLGVFVDTAAPILSLQDSSVVIPGVSVVVAFESSEPLVSAGGVLDYVLTSTDGDEHLPDEVLLAPDGNTVLLTFSTQIQSGSYTLDVAPGAEDFAGNTGANTQAFPVTIAIPNHIIEISPFDEEDVVSVAREITIRTSQDLDVAQSDLERAVQVRAAGLFVTGTLTAGVDNRSIRFRPDSQLPSSTQVVVDIDGSFLIGTDGQAADLDLDGVPGGTVRTSFRTANLTRVAGTTVSGRVFESDVLDGDGADVPLEGVTIRVQGIRELFATTDADGSFTLVDTPAGEFFIEVDGTTAPDSVGGRLPSIPKTIVAVAGVANQLDDVGGPGDIYLPRIASEDSVAILAGQDTTVGVGDVARANAARIAPTVTSEQLDLLTVEIPADSLSNEDGTAPTEATILILDRDRLPGPLPPNQTPAFVFSIEANGAENVDGFVQLTYPNVDGLAPGERRFLMSFDHEAGEWVPTGVLTVSADGSVLESEPNSGIRTLGWRYVAPEPTTSAGINFFAPDLAARVINFFFGSQDAETPVDDGERFTVFTYPQGTTSLQGAIVTRAVLDDPNDPVQRTRFQDDIRSAAAGDGIPASEQVPRSGFFAAESVGQRVARLLGEPRGPENEFPDVDRDQLAENLALVIEIAADGIQGFAPEFVSAVAMGDPSILFEPSAAIRETVDHFLNGQGATFTRTASLDGPPNAPLAFAGPGFQLLRLLFPDDLPDTSVPTPRGDPIAIEALQSRPVLDLISRFQESFQEALQQQANQGFIDIDGLAVSGLLSERQVSFGDISELLESNLRGLYGGLQGYEISIEEFNVEEALSDPSNNISDREVEFNAQITIRLNDVFGVNTSELAMQNFNFPGAEDLPGVGGVAAEGINFLNRIAELGLASQFLLQHGPRGDAQPFINQILLTDIPISGSVQIPPGLVGRPATIIEATADEPAPRNDLIPILVPQTNGLVETIESPSPDTTGDVFFLIETEAGVLERGRLNAVGRQTLMLPADADVTVSFFQPSSGLGGRYDLQTAGPGQNTVIPTATSGNGVGLGPVFDNDSDNDGISDFGEFVLGSNPDAADSDGDGAADLAEILDGQNFADERVVPAGIVASVALAGETQDVVVEPSSDGALTAYAATGSFGLAVIDVTRADRPAVLGQIDLEGFATDVALSPRLQRAVVTSESAIHIVDVSDPAALATLQTIDAAGAAVEVFEDLAYVAVGERLQQYDLASGELVQEIGAGGGRITGISREGDILYVVTDTQRLQILETNGTEALTLRGSLTLPPQISVVANDIFVGGGIAYIANGIENTIIDFENDLRGGYSTVDVSNIDSPVLISLPDTPEVAAGNLGTVVNGSGLALVAGGFRGLEVHAAPSPEVTYSFVTRFETPGNANSVTLANGLAFVADDTAGLQIINYLAADTQGVAPNVAISFGDQPLDEDAATPGLQVTEGRTLPQLVIDVSDDFEVATVELLLNDVVVVSDVAFPYDTAVNLPSVVAAASVTGPVTLQVRATDTGGNVGVSNTIEIDVLPDTAAPLLLSSSVDDGDEVREGFRSIRLQFSEPIDTATVNASTVQLVRLDAGREVVEPLDVAFRSSNQEVQFTYDTLVAGEYELRLRASTISDPFRNTLGLEDVVTNFTVAGATAVWANPAGGLWSDPANWVGGVLPAPGADVLIDIPGDAVIIHDAGNTQINSLTSSNAFVLEGGTLEIANELVVTNDLSFTGAGVLVGATVVGDADFTAARVVANNRSGPFATSRDTRFVGVTFNRDLTLEARSRPVVEQGLEVNGRVSYEPLFDGRLSERTTLFVEGSQSFTGSGTIDVSGPGVRFAANIINLSSGSTLTVAPDITIRGTRGEISGGGGTTLINQGTIVADEAEAFQFTLTVSTSEFVNDGLVQANSGGNVFLFTDTENRGVYDVAEGAVLTLARDYAFADLGVIQGSGNVTLAGDIENTNETFVLAPFGGTWTLGADINGGVLEIEDGALVEVTSLGLTGVTINSDFTVDRFAQLRVTDSLTVNGMLTFAAEGDGGTRPRERILLPQSDVVLDGTGELVFLGGADGRVRISRSNIGLPLNLEIGPELTLRGSGVEIGNRSSFRFNPSGSVLLNRGRILVEGPGNGFAIGNSMLPGSFINAGSIEVAEGNVLQIEGFDYDNQGRLIVEQDGRVVVPGVFSQSSGEIDLRGGTVEGSLSIDGGDLIGTGVVTGDLSNAGRIVLGDVGTVGTLEVGGGFVQTTTGSIESDIAGLIPGQDVDALVVSGLAELGGVLNIIFGADFAPPVGERITLITFSERIGEFDSVTDGGVSGFDSDTLFEDTSVIFVRN